MKNSEGVRKEREGEVVPPVKDGCRGVVRVVSEYKRIQVVLYMRCNQNKKKRQENEMKTRKRRKTETVLMEREAREAKRENQ